MNMNAKNCKANPAADRHEWKKYVGFTKVFEYCEHCDEKRPYVEPLVVEPPKPDYKTDCDRKTYNNLTPLHSDIFDAMKYLLEPRTLQIPKRKGLEALLPGGLIIFSKDGVSIKNIGEY